MAAAFFSVGAGPTRARTIDRLSSEVYSRGSTSYRTTAVSRGSSVTARSQSLLTESLTSDDADHGMLHQQSTIPLAAANVCAEVMGAGVLSLPHACSILGWVGGLSVVCTFGALSAYTGVILIRIKVEYFPEAESYGDLADAMFGPAFGRFTRACVLISWAALLPFFLIAFVNALRVALPQLTLCFVGELGIVAAILLLPMQLQTLHVISYAATLSTIAMLAASAIALTELVTTVPTPPSPLLSPPPHTLSPAPHIVLSPPSHNISPPPPMGLSPPSIGNTNLDGLADHVPWLAEHVPWLATAAIGAVANGSGATVTSAMAMLVNATDSSPRIDFPNGGAPGLQLANDTDSSTSLWPPALVGPHRHMDVAALLDLAGAACSVVFAYLGQSLYLEIAREMRNPADFHSVSLLANSGYAPQGLHNL